MQIHKLTQGTPEWHAYRSEHFNASDAPAMMGCSSFKTRSDLMKECATGLTAEVDASTQRRFNDGHRFEALARPIAEAIIHEDLYPIVGSMGVYSASFDGATMAENIIFEHKSLNTELRSAITDEACGYMLPLQYRVQMEQQLMVSGAEKCLFMASKWDGDKLVEERHTWYYPDLELRAQIVAGWEQFAKDLVGYTPTAKTVAAVAAPVEALPAVSVRLDGQLVVASNLPEFGVALRAFIGRIPNEPSTDQEFADCESACKALKKAEDALEASETHALAQMTDVEAMRRTIADLRTLARVTRLAREKMVTARKDSIRLEIVANACAALRDHIITLNTRIGRQYMPAILADFAGVIKGKRSIDSVNDAVDTELARAKIAANEVADRIQINLNSMPATHAILFADLATLCTKPADDFTAIVKGRIAEHQLAVDAQLLAAAEKQAAETKAIAEAAAVEQPTLLHGSLPVSRAQFDRTYAAPVRTAPATPPSLKLGQIAERLGFNLTADFLSTIGFEAHIDRNARLYHEHDFPLICAALVRHINSVQVALAA